MGEGVTEPTATVAPPNEHPPNPALVPVDKRRFGRYSLLYRFGAGGMANIYLARLLGAQGFEKLIALKVIHDRLAFDPQFVKMFIDEARLASRINHPNVAHTFEFGRVDDTYFIAMEYVEGESLSAILKQRKPGATVSARIIADAAAGLHAAHETRGADGKLLEVVHRDVSPHNIMVSYSGSVKLVDFGVARARGKLHTTQQGSLKGKFSYMAPELIEHAPVDRRTDIFSLGIVLYETITRRRLFKGETEAETLNKVLNLTIPPPSEYADDCPPALEAIVMRALERRQADRFPTALEMQQALERFLMESGKVVLPADVGEMMDEVFHERILEKRLLLERCVDAALDVVPEVEGQSASTLGLPSTTKPGETKSRLMVLLGITLLGLAAVALVLFFALREEPPPPVPPVEAPPVVVKPPSPVRQISITIKATPATATIVFDGKPVKNPFQVQRPAAEGTAQVSVTAPDHKPKELAVSLGQGGYWEIQLEREREVKTEEPKKEPEPKHPRRPRKKRPKRKSDFLDSPYRKQ
jgi:serine/threonine-protein kinase